MRRVTTQKTGCLLALLFSATSFAAGSRVDKAFRSARGELLVVTSGSSGESVYWGSPDELHQMEVLGKASSEASIAFYRGLGSQHGKERSSEIAIDDTGARVECDARDGTEAFVPLVPAALKALETRIRSGKTRLSALPGTLEPLYLFEAGKELVLVLGPVFNFRGDFRVLMGLRGHLKPIAVDHAPERASEAEQGHIRFSRGGGLFIPLTIDLMGREGNRGTPSLIRSDEASLEALSMPHLSRAEIESLGFGKPIRAPLFNPCDRGRTVQVGPRSL